MINSFSTEKLIAVAIGSCVLASLASVLALQLRLPPAYPEFIVGHLAWHAQTKLQDLIVAPVFIAVLVGSFWSAAHLLGSGTAQPRATSGSELASQLFWWSIPAATAIAGLLIGSLIDVTLIAISAAALVCILIVAVDGVLTQTPVRYSLLGTALLAAVLLAAIPLEIALLLGRAPARLVGEIDLFRYIRAASILLGIGLGTIVVLALRAPERLFRELPELLLIGQIGLPVLFLTLYPARLATPDGGIATYATTPGLKVVILAAVVVGVGDVVWRYLRHRDAPSEALERLLSPIALFALLVAWRVGSTVPPHVSPDDYHFGELLLGWWSYLQGALPYVESIPAHGIVEDDFAGFLSLLFYDGTAGTIFEARRLSIAILGFVAFAAILRFSRSLGLAFISVGFISWSPTWLFLTPFLCLWLSPALRRRPARWLSIWILTAPVVVLGAPGPGLLLVAASAVIALDAAWRLWRSGERHGLTGLGASLAVVLAAGLITPMGPMVLGAVGYVLENGPVNQVAWGVPWALSWSASPQSGLVFEAIRMSWVAVPVACVAIISISMTGPQRRDHLLPAVVVLLFVLLLIPYAMGRIDPGAISRAGRLASLGWAVLLPVVAWNVIKPRHRSAFILLIAAISATLNFTPLSLPHLMSGASAQIATGPLRDAESAGLANIGRAMVDDAHWERLISLNTLINSKLAPEEPYLDLTSRNARYFYFNRKPPVSVTAPYNMVPIAQQQRAVAELARDLPRLAVLAADNVAHDGALALRTPLLYRFVIDHYIPRWEKGFIIGDSKQQDGARQTPGDVTLEVALDKTVSDDAWDRGVGRHEAALMLDDAVLVGVLTQGLQVQFPDGEHRTIVRVWPEGSVIWLDGDVLDRGDAEVPGSIKVTIDGATEHAYRVALFEKAFSVPDLGKIPVSWGKSEKSLRQRMALVREFGALPPAVHDLVEDTDAREGHGIYRVTGSDPHVTFDLSQYAISGGDAGLLRLEFACLDRTAEPRLQVFWWGDQQAEPEEAASLRVTAADGVLLVPLDAFPRWLALGQVRGLRLDLDDASACGAIAVRNPALYQRTATMATEAR